MQDQLFSASDNPTQSRSNHLKSGSPLAHRARPEELAGYVGWEHLTRRYPFLADEFLQSLILYGPPGTGKTTLARLLARSKEYELYPFSAVLSGLPDLRKLIARAKEVQERQGRRAVIFIDEIHRFNKAQQDALLPDVEAGNFILIGATTENPKVSVNRALLSRLSLVELKKHSPELMQQMFTRGLELLGIELAEEVGDFVRVVAGGDARKMYNSLELLASYARNLNLDPREVLLEDVKSVLLENAREFDRKDDRHYDVISAFIKSMRGTDPNAALLWLAVMLDGGEDPVFIARRLVIFASEDVGNADPRALSLATAALQAVQLVGMPEARISLAQATTYLASTVKSNRAYKALDEALEYVRARPTLEVPEHLKNFPAPGAPKYRYPHEYPNGYVRQDYTCEKSLPEFYNPTENGMESALKKRLDSLKET